MPSHHLEAIGYQRSPAGLMARTEATAIVAMKVLVEQHQVSKVRIAIVAASAMTGATFVTR